MDAIGDNRLNKDERVAIRRAIHKVVPWVMEAERNRLVLLEAQASYRSRKADYEFLEGRAESERQTIKDAHETIAKHAPLLKEAEADSALFAHAVMQAGLEIAKLRES